MDPLQRSYSRRALLPVEQQIIDALDLTLDEYWQFCRLADCKAKERGEEYALIPDVVQGAETYAIVSLVVSVLSTAAAFLLQPQLPEPGRAAIRTADVRGQTKFAELFSFDSLQDIAVLGSIIPLVFTRQIVDPADPDGFFGGVRVKAMLLWSQLLSRGTHQELKMLTTLGLASLTTPDPEGFAVGDQLLRSYHDSRYKAYFVDNLSGGGRIKESDAITNAGSLPPLEHDDVFQAYDRVADTFTGLFCGARTPSSQTTFGCHNPIPNGALYHIPYDIVQLMKGSKGKLFNKRQKLVTPYSGRMAMNELHRAIGGSSVFASDPESAVPVDIFKDDELVFTIGQDREDPDGFPPFGLSDVNSAIDQRAIDADTKIAIGDLFLFGTALLKCEGIRSDDPWEVNGERREKKQFEFKCLERGFGNLANVNATEAGSIPYYNTHLQEVNIGTVTNNRKCHQTEIGIKSIVFKRIDNFANVQTEPDAATLREFEQDRQPFSLGRVSAYQTRYSFFRLELRDVNTSTDTVFTDVMPGEYFAVKGSNPQPQFNTVRITHPFGEYEFRLVPVPGTVFNELYFNKSFTVNLLDGKGRTDVQQEGDFIISYTGRRTTLTRANVSNVQFEFQSIEDQTILVSGIVDKFTKNGTDKLIGEDPIGTSFKLQSTAVDFNNDDIFLNYGVLVNVDNPTANGATYAAWGGVQKSLEIIETDGYIYRKGSTKIQTIPATAGTWQSTQELPFITEGTPLSNHNYVKFGSTSQATQLIVSGNEVSLSLFEQPGQENLNALYRQGSESKQLLVPNDPVRVVADAPNNNGELYQAFVFYVIEHDNGSLGGKWANEFVFVGQPATEANPIQYRKGVNLVYRDENLKFNVFPIYRVQYQEPTLTDFTSVEVGQYGAGNEVARDLFEIERYKRVEQREFASGGAPAEYSLSGGSGTGLKINASSFDTGKWQWLVSDGGSGYKQGEVLTHTFGDGTEVSIQIQAVRDQVVEVPGREQLNPLDAIADFPKYELERTSHQDGPEHTVAFVNELVRPGTKPDQVTLDEVQYNDLSLLGLRVLAGRDWTSMGQLTAYVKQGIKVERLISDAGGDLDAPLTAATNNFAEIAYNLLVNKRIGAGQKIPAETVDRDAMIIAAKFCHANGFTYDGVVEDKVALREFIHQNAAFNLLDFKVVGGKFSLEPSVPYNSANYKIQHTQDINKQIKALFTDGNIKDMQVSFLKPEERQLTQAVVAYREEEPNGFSEQKTLRFRFKDQYGGSETDPENAIDLTSFCTNRLHAQTIALYTLTTRKHIDHTISFKTTPSSAMALNAGDYIKVISNATHTSRFYNGSVDGEGNITATAELIDAPDYDIFYWKPRSGEQSVIEGQMPVADMKTGDETFFNSIFTLKMKNELKRVYRVDSLTVDDEGYVDVTGTHQPLTSIGSLATINLDLDQFLPGSDDTD